MGYNVSMFSLFKNKREQLLAKIYHRPFSFGLQKILKLCSTEEEKQNTLIKIQANFRKKLEKDWGVPRSQIYAYTFSALSNACACCKRMDGAVVNYEDYLKIPTPLHKYCSCIWVAILKDEVNPPPITGLPKGKIRALTLEEIYQEHLN